MPQNLCMKNLNTVKPLHPQEILQKAKTRLSRVYRGDGASFLDQAGGCEPSINGHEATLKLLGRKMENPQAVFLNLDLCFWVCLSFLDPPKMVVLSIFLLKPTRVFPWESPRVEVASRLRKLPSAEFSASLAEPTANRAARRFEHVSVVQWLPFFRFFFFFFDFFFFFFFFFLSGCPTKMVFPKKGPLFFPGSLNN